MCKVVIKSFKILQETTSLQMNTTYRWNMPKVQQKQKGFHRIIKNGKYLWDYLVQPSTYHQCCLLPMSFNATTPWLLKPAGMGIPPPPGQLCQCLTALWVKKLFPISNLILPSTPWSHLLSSYCCHWEQSPTPTSPQPPLRIWREP